MNRTISDNTEKDFNEADEHSKCDMVHIKEDLNVWAKTEPFSPDKQVKEIESIPKEKFIEELSLPVVVVEPKEMEIEEDLYYLKFSETERDLIFEYFKHFISNKILPRQNEIMTFLAKYEFKDIVWTDIKQKIQSKIGNEGKKNERKLCHKKEGLCSLDNKNCESEVEANFPSDDNFKVVDSEIGKYILCNLTKAKFM